MHKIIDLFLTELPQCFFKAVIKSTSEVVRAHQGERSLIKTSQFPGCISLINFIIDHTAKGIVVFYRIWDAHISITSLCDSIEMRDCGGFESLFESWQMEIPDERGLGGE